MDIKWSRTFQKKWNEFSKRTAIEFGKRKAIENAQRLDWLVNVIRNNPKYGIPEPMLQKSKRHDYRSIILISSYKIIYYPTDSTIYLADLWNMRMSPERLTRPYKR